MASFEVNMRCISITTGAVTLSTVTINLHQRNRRRFKVFSNVSSVSSNEAHGYLQSTISAVIDVDQLRYRDSMLNVCRESHQIILSLTMIRNMALEGIHTAIMINVLQ